MRTGAGPSPNSRQISLTRRVVIDLKNNYLITVIGPTAIGKTALSILLAKHFNSDIISCDSRQFFKEMTIGTAVPDKVELSAVQHHFIQNKRYVEEKYL